MNRTTAAWFGLAGVLVLVFGALYQVVDPACYDAATFVDHALVVDQAVVAVSSPLRWGGLFLLVAAPG